MNDIIPQKKRAVMFMFKNITLLVTEKSKLQSKDKIII